VKYSITVDAGIQLSAKGTTYFQINYEITVQKYRGFIYSDYNYQDGPLNVLNEYFLNIF
jgi:hypothetical protein